MNTDTKYNLIRDIFINKALEAADEDDGREYEPSDKFKVTLNKNLRSNGMEPFYSFFSVKRRRVLAVIAAVIAAFALSMSVGAIRERVVNFFIEMFNTFAVITTDKNNDYPDKIEERFIPTNIPEGFTVIESQTEKYVSIIIWRKGSNEIIFKQLTKNSITIIDTEKMFKRINVFEESDGLLYGINGDYTAFFEHFGYYFQISIYGDISETELINIAKSIEKAEFTKS